MNVDRVVGAQEIARFVAGLDFASLPHEVKLRARLALIDTIGCWIAGSQLKSAQLATRAAHRQSATVSPVMAAMAGAIASSALDFDDGHYEGGGTHLGSIIVPALMSVVDDNTSLPEFLSALVAGYEIAIRTGYLLAPRSAHDTYHASGAASCIGAAVAVSKILGLDQHGILSAIRLSSAQMPQANLQLPMVKESIGWGASTAVASAFLAAEGFDGSPEAVQLRPVLDLPPTPFDALPAEHPFVAHLDRWHILQTYFKPYACCRAFHSALDALKQILDEHRWTAADITSIDVETLSTVTGLDYFPPLSPEHAQFSFPYAIACVAAYGEIGPEQMEIDRFSNALVVDVARKITLRGSAVLDAKGTVEGYPAILNVHARGESVRREAYHASGGPRMPWSEIEVIQKFKHNAKTKLTSLQAEALVSCLLDPEQKRLPPQSFQLLG